MAPGDTVNGPQNTPAGLLLYTEWLAEQDREHWAEAMLADEDFTIEVRESTHPGQSPEHDASDAAYVGCKLRAAIARSSTTTLQVDLYEQALAAAPAGTVTKSMLDDLEYFKRKLYVALAVPKEYLGKAR